MKYPRQKFLELGYQYGGIIVGAENEMYSIFGF